MDARLYLVPQDHSAIPIGLEMECSRALNAVPLSKSVTVKYAPNGDAILLVGGKQSKALSTLALYMGVDGVLDVLSAFGRATTTYRERNSNAF